MEKNNDKELLKSAQLAIKYGYGYYINGTTWIDYNGAEYEINSFYEPRTRDITIVLNGEENQNKNGLLRNIGDFVLNIVNPHKTFTRINRRLENGNEQQAEFDGVQDKILSMMLWKYIKKHPRR